MQQMADILANARRSGVSPWKHDPYEMPDDLKKAAEETRRKIREAFEEKHDRAKERQSA
jgi:hypothetical protein